MLIIAQTVGAMKVHRRKLNSRDQLCVEPETSPADTRSVGAKPLSHELAYIRAIAMMDLLQYSIDRQKIGIISLCSS